MVNVDLTCFSLQMISTDLLCMCVCVCVCGYFRVFFPCFLILPIQFFLSLTRSTFLLAVITM